MTTNHDKNWANVVLQVLLHVPSLWAHILAHACSISTKDCPAGILKKLSSALLGPETIWGNEHCDKVFQDLGKIEDPSEALSKVFSAIKECEELSMNVTGSVDRLVGVGSTTTIKDSIGHESVSPPTYNCGFSLNSSKLTSRTPIETLLQQSIAPFALTDYACEKCPERVVAEKTTTYFPPPPAVLFVTLNLDSSGPGVEFLQPVFLPGTLFQYNLAAVICFKADQYWAVVKKMDGRKPPVWIKAFDRRVIGISWRTLAGISYGKAAVILIYEYVVDADPGDAELKDDDTAPLDGRKRDDDDDVGDPATTGTVRTSKPEASPPQQSGINTPSLSNAQIDLTDAEAVNEALHTHTHHIRIIVCSNIVHHFRTPMIRPLTSHGHGHHQDQRNRLYFFRNFPSTRRRRRTAVGHRSRLPKV